MDKIKYDHILQILCSAELAARNNQWPTCGTYCRLAMETAFQFAKEEEPPLGNPPD